MEKRIFLSLLAVAILCGCGNPSPSSSDGGCNPNLPADDPAGCKPSEQDFSGAMPDLANTMNADLTPVMPQPDLASGMTCPKEDVPPSITKMEEFKCMSAAGKKFYINGNLSTVGNVSKDGCSRLQMGSGNTRLPSDYMACILELACLTMCGDPTKPCWKVMWQPDCKSFLVGRFNPGTNYLDPKVPPDEYLGGGSIAY